MNQTRRRKPPRASPQNGGFTVLEIAVAMAVGTILSVGLLLIGQSFQKSFKQVKDIGNFIQVKRLLLRQLSNMSSSCQGYILQGNTPLTATSPIPVTLLKSPTHIPSGSPVPTELIQFNADGSTLVDGRQYFILLSIIDSSCFPNPTLECTGQLTLQMKRRSTIAGSGQNSFGLDSLSEQVADLKVRIDHQQALITDCTKAPKPSPPPPFPAENGKHPCGYPPGQAKAVAPVGTDSQPQNFCTVPSVILGVCAAGMVKLPMPDTTPPPIQVWEPKYCQNNKDSPNPGVNSELGCCGLQDPTQQSLSPHWIDQGSCDLDKSEIVTGICNPNPKADLDPFHSVTSKNYPDPAGHCGSNRVQCSVIKDQGGHMIKYQKYFCHEFEFSVGEMTSCEEDEVMVGFWSSDKRGNGRSRMKCCPISRPPD